MACNVCGIHLGVFARSWTADRRYRPIGDWISQRPDEEKIMSSDISRQISGIIHVLGRAARVIQQIKKPKPCITL